MNEYIVTEKDGSTMKYSGKVTLKLISNGGKVQEVVTHNQGKDELFYFLCNCLISNYNDVNSPKYIGIGYTDIPTTDAQVGDISDDDIVMSSKVVIKNRKVATSNGKYVARMEATLPGVVATDDSYIIKAYLYSSGENPIAETTLSKVIHVIKAELSSIVILWELSFSN